MSEELPDSARLIESYRPADTRPELWRLTVGELLLRNAGRYPDRPALQMVGEAGLESVSWGELAHRARGAARQLLQRLEPGDAVGVWGANSIAWVVAEYASALAGTILVPLNTSLADAEVSDQLTRADVRVVLAAEDHRGRSLLERARKLAADLPREPAVLPLQDWETAEDPGGRLPVVSPDAPFLIQYTSGTTGRPKGAVLSHFSCVNTARFGMDRQRTGAEREVMCSLLPLHHVGASVCAVLVTASTADTLVTAAGFDVDRLLDLIEATGATILGVVPTMVTDLLAHPGLKSRDLSTLRVVMGGGASVSPALIRDFQQALDVQFTVGYGQSESPMACSSDVDDSDEDKALTLGRPSPHREARITSISTGGVAAVDEPGELWIRSPLNMLGYHEMPEQTESVLDKDAWLHTGDLCSMDGRGVITFHGRLREVVIRGGENVYPREVEEVLAAHPAVAVVAVLGLPDPRLGETVAACVQLNPGSTVDAQALEAFAAERLASFKVPRAWRFVAEFPLTGSGKIRRTELRRAFASAQHA
ncbi:class I adenylate-forming enzyme family protein [Streptomyces sp. NPDC005349]|uniref:class I adenylate-forming enzyme family protein n=1 Tax=Streptomyces sp. NPDC005349 TaxID=3157037 RepID=UPI0033A27900